MSSALRVIVVVALFGVAGFCAFGFLASYELTEASARRPWLIGYGLVGCLSFGGALALLFAVARQPYEIAAAQALGWALPLLEIARRRTDFSDPPAYVDDLLMGALLLWASRVARRGQARGRVLLAGAWGVLCGGLYYSVFGQLSSPAAQDISGLPNAAVVIVKLMIYGMALLGLVLSVRRARENGIE
ncbi:MAG: hypothetical protein ACT4PU_07135 [Planctomycetota bacterium]